MELYMFIFILSTVGTAVSTVTKAVHRDIQFTGCSDTEREFMYGLDQEELYHSDFIRKQGVITAPDFADPVSFEGFYDGGVSNMEVCKQNLDIANKAHNYPTEETAPPEIAVYPEDDVVLGEENSLICHVTGLYPPPVMISWTKNNVNVTENMSLSQYRPKTDETYNIFSTLKITPEQGDIYSCTVNHKALQDKSETKTWEVDVALPSVGPAVFCGVGLSLGLLGVAAGTFFLIKGNNCN